MSEIRALHRRAMNMVSRGVIETSDDEPGMQQVKVSLLYGEDKASVERFQNYGFSSHPPGDTEALVVFVGGGRDHGVIVATDDRSSRFTGLKAGEVAIYTAEGDSITLKSNNEIEIRSARNLTIKTDEAVTLETKGVSLKGSETFELDAPSIKLKGNIELDGNLSATGSITAPSGSLGP